MRLHWLDDVLTDAGLEVVEHPGWHDRGRELQSVERLICHHTATGPNWTDKRVVDLLVKGRPDLPGPLSQLGLDRQGRFHLIAAGKANHNGYGLSGNNTIGIEAFNDGKGELWLAVQMDAYIRGCAAICRHLGWPAEKVLGHKESDPGRKVDPTFDMPTFRGHVAALLSAPLPAPPQQEDDEMYVIDPGIGALFLVNGSKVTLFPSGEDYLAFAEAHPHVAAFKCSKKFIDNLLAPGTHAAT